MLVAPLVVDIAGRDFSGSVPLGVAMESLDLESVQDIAPGLQVLADSLSCRPTLD